MALNLKPPHEIRATYRIVTPMFIGDAEQNATGISPQSVKGALRFWWRALQWGEIRSQEKFNTDEKALCELHEQEAKLFGIAMDEKRERANKNRAPENKLANGQGQFTLRVLHPKLSATAKNTVHSEFKANDAARYFGYGLMEAFDSNKKGTKAAQLNRSCIDAGQTFEVHLVFRGAIDDSIKNALTMMGLLGGLGSRVRRGIGSISLEKLTHSWKEYQVSTKTYQDNIVDLYTLPKNEAEYISLIQKYLPNTSHTNQPPFSAFSMESRIDLLVRRNSALAALNDLAKGMVTYRSWGKEGKVLNGDSEKNFPTDHDWKDKDRPKDFHPRRVMFGLPHNYGQGDKYAVNPEKQREPYPKGYYKHDRRASPLLFHVHKVGSEYLGISILLPAQFLPKDEKINAGGKNVPTKVEWSVLTNLLDGTIRMEENGELRFPKKTPILRGKAIQ